MTVKKRIAEIIDGLSDMETDSWEKVVCLAYWLGRESATKKVSDDYRNMITAMRERASNCRYKNMANAVIGAKDWIYESDYDQGMTVMFGSDETKL